MTKKETEVRELEESEEATFAVVDPDDYRKTKKLQAIQKSKDHYKEYKRNRNQKMKELKDQWSNWREAYRERQASAIADYASELMPLIEEGLENDTLSEDDLIASLGPNKADLDVRMVAKEGGQVPIGENRERKSMPKPNCDEVYRQLERIERKLGLGLELEENKGPAEI
jgi:hypothetical protein